MTKRLAPTERKAYTIAEAAAVCGVSEDTIKKAADRGDLIKRYPTTRPVILAADLDAWLKSLPDRRAS